MATRIQLAVEASCAALISQSLVSASLSASVFNGLDNREKPLPCVICYAERSEPIIYGQRIYDVTTNIVVAESAADTAVSDAGTMSDVVFNAFLGNNRAANLTNATASSFTCYDIIEGVTSNGIEQDAWIQTLSLRIIGVQND